MNFCARGKRVPEEERNIFQRYDTHLSLHPAEKERDEEREGEGQKEREKEDGIFDDVTSSARRTSTIGHTARLLIRSLSYTRFSLPACYHARTMLGGSFYTIYDPTRGNLLTNRYFDFFKF